MRFGPALSWRTTRSGRSTGTRRADPTDWARRCHASGPSPSARPRAGASRSGARRLRAVDGSAPDAAGAWILEAVSVMLPIAVVALFVIAMSERLADRAGVVAPVLLLVLGTGVAAIPAVPAMHADPDIILEVILPGLLHASAVKMPMPEFRRNLGPIATLSVLLVALSAVVVGTVLHTLVPGLGLAAAIALGAVVSPTDAVATSIVRRAGVSQRIIAVFEGEGLVNDASALVIMSSALAAGSGPITAGRVVDGFCWAVLSAVVVGLPLGHGMLWLRARGSSTTADMLPSLATPYAAFLVVERLGGSGLIAAVVRGLVESHRSSSALEAAQRSTNQATWAEISLVLESSVFLLMGLQLPAALADEQDVPPTRAVVLALLLVVRALVVALMLAAARPPFVPAREAQAGRRARPHDGLAQPARAPRLAPEPPQGGAPHPAHGADAVGHRPLRAGAPRRPGGRDHRLGRHAGRRDRRRRADAAERAARAHGDDPHRLLRRRDLPRAAGRHPGALRRRGAPGRRRSGLRRGEGRAAPGHACGGLRVPVPEELKEALDDLRAAAAAHGGAGEGADEETERVSRAQNLLGRAGVAGRLPADRRLAELAGRHALEVIDAQRRALLAVNQTGRYSPAALTGILRVLDADQAGLELRMRV